MCKLGTGVHLSLSLAGFLLSCHISRLSLATALARETEPRQKIVSFSDFEDICCPAVVLLPVLNDAKTSSLSHTNKSDFKTNKVSKVLYLSIGQSCHVHLFAVVTDGLRTRKLQFFILSTLLLRTTESGQEVRTQSQKSTGMFSCVASKTSRTWRR